MTTSNIVTDTKEQRRTLRTADDSWLTIMSFAVPEGKTAEVYAKIVGANNAKTSRAVWTAEGLFYRNAGGDVTADGSITKPKSGGLAGDVDIVVNTSDQTVDIKVKGVAATVVHWEADGEIRLREDTEDYDGDPRMQITIVKMREKKKLGWCGLTDGLNFVLVPDVYSGKKIASPYSNTEKWSFNSTKDIGGSAYTDYLKFTATKVGPGATPTTSQSVWKLKWMTQTGDFGTGAVKTVTVGGGFTVYIQGWLQNRMMFGSFKNDDGVAFLWGKHDAEGWINYPTTTPTS